MSVEPPKLPLQGVFGLNFDEVLNNDEVVIDEESLGGDEEHLWHWLSSRHNHRLFLQNHWQGPVPLLDWYQVPVRGKRKPPLYTLHDCSK